MTLAIILASIGISSYFQLLKKGNTDAWELELRTSIEGNFHDGKLLNDYVNVAFVAVESLVVARIEVNGRKRLSFMRDKTAGGILFRRQGNRSVAVSIVEAEEFFALRHEKEWC